ncbi:MAG TPA: ABC transporter permease [Chloroflexota bacterium]|jgi:peptide/nickel transport system permease protein|nr:ABC transporter permease [Chloroflexota bacterium]
MSAATLAIPRGRVAPPTFWARLRREVRRYPIGFLGLAIVLVVVLLALTADWITPYDPAWQIDERLTPPNADYVLGLDEFGRDVYSRVIYGARVSLYAGVVSVVLIALPVGTVLGVLAGYFRGWVDTILSRIVDVMFAFPSIILAIAIVGIFGASLTNAMIAIGIVYAPTFARIARGSTLSVANLDYITASRTIGAKHARIIWRHVLPNIAAPLIVQTTLALSTAILFEAALSFLGLGTQPPTPSWGTMLGTGRRYMELAPWTAIYPGLAIMITVLGFNLAGDGLRDALDPRLREG